ncbi:MAG: response regulator transcription factor [Armatimonadetes bacterium]|nr:response regulator transcription factor [Armatimonadota bacterium]
MESKPISILLVDDHAIVREGLRLVLSSQNDLKVVGEASSGSEALALVARLSPDMVVMDIGMPDMDGVETTRRIREAHENTHVLILSVHENEEYLLHVLKAGASGYVPKKAAGIDLVNAIRAVHRGDAYIHPSMTRPLVSDYLRRVEQESSHVDYDSLTEREIEVLKLIAEGLTNQVIAEKLFLSIKTVQAHRGNIMSKLDLHDRTALVRYAIRKGLIDS